MKNTFNLSVALIIKTSEPLELISQIMGVMPTGCLEKGESIHSFQPKADKNTWWLKESYGRKTDLGASLQNYFESIPRFIEKIDQIKQIATCALRISVVSIYGQIYFSLSPRDTELLSQIGIPFEVSIFSYGDCIEE